MERVSLAPFTFLPSEYKCERVTVPLGDPQQWLTVLRPTGHWFCVSWTLSDHLDSLLFFITDLYNCVLVLDAPLSCITIVDCSTFFSFLQGFCLFFIKSHLKPQVSRSMVLFSVMGTENWGLETAAPSVVSTTPSFCSNPKNSNEIAVPSLSVYSFVPSLSCLQTLARVRLLLNPLFLSGFVCLFLRPMTWREMWKKNGGNCCAKTLYVKLLTLKQSPSKYNKQKCSANYINGTPYVRWAKSVWKNAKSRIQNGCCTQNMNF